MTRCEPIRPQPPPVVMSAVPQELQDRDQWVAWRYQKRGEKWTKVPIDPNTGDHADTTDVQTWGSLPQALDHMKRAKLDGVGFVFARSAPFVGIDVDGCLSPGGTLTPEAGDIIRRFGTYTEVSPSGRGIKLWLRGELPTPKTGRRRDGVEIYHHGRFFTVTGQHLPGTPRAIHEFNGELSEWYTSAFPEQPARKSIAVEQHLEVDSVHVDRIISKARSAANAGRFRRLFDDGDTSDYPSHSEAELALCSMLAFWCGPNVGLIDQCFRQSALMREKWDRDDYREATIDRALDGINEFFDWTGRSGNIVAPKSVETFQPFPTAVLPEPVCQFVATGSNAIGCDASFLALPLLTVCAAAIGNTRRLRLSNTWRVPPILWTAIVGESGTQKTPAFRLVMRPVRERQRRALQAHVERMSHHTVAEARWEKDFAAWKRDKDSDTDPPMKPEAPAAERFVVSDTTVEALAPLLLENPRGLLLACDELAAWFGSFDRYARTGKASSDAAHWLSMFNADAVVVDRKTSHPPTIAVPSAAICVTGGIQPGILHRALGAEHRESGLAARLLLASPPRKPKCWTDADIDDATESSVAGVIDALYAQEFDHDDNGHPIPALVDLSPEAKRLWIEFVNDHGAEQFTLTGELAAAWSKLEDYAARLALIIHCIRRVALDNRPDGRPELLDVTSLQAGIDLIDWFKHETKRVYALLDESNSQRDQRQLAEWIERKGGSVTIPEVQRGNRRFSTADEAGAALESLVRTGYGRWESVSTTQRFFAEFRGWLMSFRAFLFIVW